MIITIPAIPPCVFRWVLGLIALCVLLVPAGTAQDPTAPEIDFRAEVKDDLGPQGLLSPEAEIANVFLIAEIGCPTPPPLTFTLVEFEVVETAPFARAVLNPSQLSFETDPADCADPDFREEVTSVLQLDVTRDAPAFRPFSTAVAMTVNSGDDAYGPYEVRFDLEPDFLPLTMVAPAQYFQKRPPGAPFEFPVTLTNLGNGAVGVKFDLSQPNRNKLENLIPPGETHLESRAQDGPDAAHQATVSISGETPRADGYVNTIYSFIAKASTRSAERAAGATDEISLTLSIQVQGGGLPSAPGVPWAAVVAAFAVGAGLARRPKPS